MDGEGETRVASSGEGASLLGVGLYTASEAERLIKVPAQRIRRWLLGYKFRHDGQTCWSDPLWQPQLSRLGRGVDLGFRDLVELKFVDAFQNAGVSLRHPACPRDRSRPCR